MQGKVEICGVNTSRLRILSAAEMDELLLRSRDGDTDARQILIEGNLRLVLSVIQRFDKRGESPDDLFQVGCIGLLKAIANFDPTKQVRFSTYGVPAICECRNSKKGVSTMTRKQALHNAIQLLAENPKYAEEVRILTELSSELPIIHWTDSSIRDTVEQYILDHGKIPNPSDFKKAGMPPHPVIKNKYKVTLKEWLEENYPQQKPTYEELKAKHTAAFIEDYLRIKPKSQEEFNRNKRPQTRGWQTVAQYHHTKTWRKLLKLLDLPLYFDMYRDHTPINIKVNFKIEEDFWVQV